MLGTAGAVPFECLSSCFHLFLGLNLGSSLGSSLLFVAHYFVHCPYSFSCCYLSLIGYEGTSLSLSQSRIRIPLLVSFPEQEWKFKNAFKVGVHDLSL